MSYNSAVLSLTSGSPLTGGGQTWYHYSADAGAAVDTAGFITDGGSRGMRVNDLLVHRDTGTNITTQHLVVSVSSTYPGAVNLSDTTTVASGTNTD